MRPSKLVYLYAGWVHDKPAREGLAALGVALGVALVFATVTANRSIAGSANKIMSTLVGSANLQASAREPNGVPESRLQLADLPGIQHTAVGLQSPVTITHAGRTVPTQLVGANLGLASNITLTSVTLRAGLILPAALASSLGVSRDYPGSVTIVARGQLTRVPVQVLGPETIGVLATSLVAFGPLPLVQRLLGLPGRISLILARGAPRHFARARASLVRAVEPHMRVSNAHNTQVLLAQALHPQDQSTAFFALLGVLIGVLLVATAMMLTMPDRRRGISTLRLRGYSRRQLVMIVLFQGIVLGGVSSLIGVLAGYGLATGVFRANPDYLASAFPLGSQTIVSIPLAVGVWIGGVVITCLCTGPVLLDLRAKRFTYQGDGEAARMIRTPTQQWMLVAAGVLLSASVVTVLVSASLIAALLLAAGLLLLVPAWLAGIVRVAERVGVRRNLLMVAAGSVRASQVRSIALAATVAIGMFGAIVAAGAHSDLLRGLEGGYARYVDSADIWVTSPSDDLATNAFPAGDLAARISKVSGVTGVRPYYGGWVDMDGRRAWLISSSNPQGVPGGQILHGSSNIVARRLREGGWVALSDQFARALHAHIGGNVSIPTPVGTRSFKLIATTTNLGWSSGVIFLPSRDYMQYWGPGSPTAFEIDSPQASSLVPAIQRIVGPGLMVQTSAQRATTADALPRQGLERLSLIAILLVISATSAIALTLGASIGQRRAELASLRLHAYESRQLQAILAWEVTLVIGAGVLLGSLGGVYGHIAADQYLRSTTGYPVVWAPGGLAILGIVLLVGIITAITLAAPGYIASRAPHRLALDGR